MPIRRNLRFRYYIRYYTCIPSYTVLVFQRKLFKERTGHRSLECLRMYERTSMKQQNAVSRILFAQKETSFSVVMTKLAENTTNISISVPVMNFHNCQVNINR